MKISLAQREYCRCTGISAEMERRGLGASRIENAWAMRSRARLDSDSAESASGPVPARKP